jgi:hypothetical protein
MRAPSSTSLREPLRRSNPDAVCCGPWIASLRRPLIHRLRRVHRFQSHFVVFQGFATRKIFVLGFRRRRIPRRQFAPRPPVRRGGKARAVSKNRGFAKPSRRSSSSHPPIARTSPSSSCARHDHRFAQPGDFAVGRSRLSDRSRGSPASARGICRRRGAVEPLRARYALRQAPEATPACEAFDPPSQGAVDAAAFRLWDFLMGLAMGRFQAGRKEPYHGFLFSERKMQPF